MLTLLIDIDGKDSAGTLVGSDGGVDGGVILSDGTISLGADLIGGTSLGTDLIGGTSLGTDLIGGVVGGVEVQVDGVHVILLTGVPVG